MSTTTNNWNENLMNEWAATQRKYWETWQEFAKNAKMPNPFSANGQSNGANPFAGFNPFANNPLQNNPLASNPFAQGTFAQNPFTMGEGSNPFANNPFAMGEGANPFANNPFKGVMEEWWSTLKPSADTSINEVAQRFFDMGKGFMSMAEGAFAGSTNEAPDTAMQMWMSGMQAMLQQWLTQVQNNMDISTPDLPGISGTTLSAWAQYADSVAPWLNMSQSFLRDMAEGHLPGGIEMPGIGAAQEQFCRALSMPGLGYNREQQESLQQLARHLLSYHDALRAYKIAFGKTALQSLNSVQDQLHMRHEKGETIGSLRELYDMWVDASEDAYGKFAMSDEYQVVYGELVNTLMRVRKDMNDMAEHQYRLMHIPTRSEIDTMQQRQQQLRRENRQLRHEFEMLRASVLKGGKTSAKPEKPAKPKVEAPKSAPIAVEKDDLTQIKGIGPKMMEKLYAQGIENFTQLAAMNSELAENLDGTLKAQGRILREDWIGQAKKIIGQ